MVLDDRIAQAGLMTDRSVSSPPAPPIPSWPAPAVGGSPERLHHPLALFVVAAIIGLGAAVATGLPTGLLAAEAAMNDCSPSDGWCGLGAALMGLLVGGLVGIVTYVGAGVAVVRRCRSVGRRAGHIAAHIVSPALFVVLAGLLSELSNV